MSRNCECGRYLGARTICECGRRADGSGGSTWDAAGPAFPGAYAPTGRPEQEDQPDDGVGPDVPLPEVSAPWGGVRGYVVEGGERPMGAAGGVGILGVGLLAVIVVAFYVNWSRLVAGLTSALVTLAVTFLGPILLLLIVSALVARIPGASGCLMVIPSMLGSGFSGRRRESPGWDLLVQTPDGLVRARLAADAPLDGDEEVVIHGPSIGGVKHAWLFQCLAPRPYTRVGRGVIRTLVVALVLLPLIVLLLVYL